jgi:hypothetical protein
VGVLLVAAVGWMAVATPETRGRELDSFGPAEVSPAARQDALH